jgi:hypothetical protein
MQRNLALATVVAMVAMSAPASAGFFNKRCCESNYNDCCTTWSNHDCCQPQPDCCHQAAPAPHYVQKTIMVPETVWEVRQYKAIECVPVVKDVPVKVCKTIEVCEPRTCQVTEYQKVCKTRTCNVKVCKTVQVVEPRTCTTYQKSVVQKQGFRTVCRKVPHVEYKTVTKDCGHWENQCVQTGCKTIRDECGCCVTVPTYRNKRVWVPNCVTQTVPVHTCRTETVQEPYTYCETICTPITKTENVTVCKTIEVVEPRTETYYECVPVTKTVTHNVKVCKTIETTEIRKCTSYEQREVVKECKVAVCKLVPKVVNVCEDPCQNVCYDPCNTCCDNGGWWDRFGFGGKGKSKGGFFKKSDCGCN